MNRPKKQKSRGILNSAIAAQKFQIARYLPTEALANFVEHYWIVHWDLRGETDYVTEVLPYPSMNLVFEANKTVISGVWTKKYDRRLEGSGKVVGIMFLPGGFYPFARQAVSTFNDRHFKLNDFFDVDAEAVEKEILSASDDATMLKHTEDFLVQHLPEQDEQIAFITRIINCVKDERRITRVKDVAAIFEMNERTLQHLFQTYVGVGLKWIIKRYRLHEAAEKLSINVNLDLSALALDLGYTDQAHFSKDFKAMVGKSPAEYARINRSASDSQD